VDKQALAVFIPILIFSIPVLAVVFNGLTKLARIRAEAQKGVSGETLDRLAELEHEVHELRRELGETQERLDFAERLLAKPRA
jgi:hypothetical protein